MLPANEDLDRRRKVWNAFAGPFVDFTQDEGTLAEDYRRIGALIVELGYSDDDARRIFWTEVVPAIESMWLRINVDNPDWLEDRIVHPRSLRFYLKCLLFPPWIGIDWGYWREIKRGIKAARDLKERPASEPFESIEDWIHEPK
ncbi:MAG TPA: hypothetical protein VFE62_01820 [Gemmataceae bacterium]|nr:hypothetical protein [Gemmataceae bacterium]